MRAARAFVRKARKSTHFHGFLGKSGSKNCRKVMKIGMKEEMGVADKKTSSVLVREHASRSQHAHLLTRSAQINSFSWYGEKKRS